MSTCEKFRTSVMRALCLGLPAPAWPGTDKRRQIRKGLFEQTGGNLVGWQGLYDSPFQCLFPPDPKRVAGRAGKMCVTYSGGTHPHPEPFIRKKQRVNSVALQPPAHENVGRCGECVRASQRDSSADAVKGPNAYRSILYQSDGASEAESGLVIRCFLRESDRNIHQRESLLPSARVGGPVATRRTAGLVTG